MMRLIEENRRSRQARCSSRQLLLGRNDRVHIGRSESSAVDQLDFSPVAPAPSFADSYFLSAPLCVRRMAQSTNYVRPRVPRQT